MTRSETDELRFAELTATIDRLNGELAQLKTFNLELATRCADQSELLSRRAERSDERRRFCEPSVN